MVGLQTLDNQQGQISAHFELHIDLFGPTETSHQIDVFLIFRVYKIVVVDLDDVKFLCKPNYKSITFPISLQFVQIPWLVLKCT